MKGRPPLLLLITACIAPVRVRALPPAVTPTEKTQWTVTTGRLINGDSLPSGHLVPVRKIPGEASDYGRGDFKVLTRIHGDHCQGTKIMSRHNVSGFRIDATLARPPTSREMPETRERTEFNAHTWSAFLNVQTELPVLFDDGATRKLAKFAKVFLNLERPSL